MKNQKNPNALYASEEIFSVTDQWLADLKQKALQTPRKRFRLCLHHANADQTHEMVIVFHQGTFMPPHRHPIGKSESYHVIEGTMTVYFFDDVGKVTQTIDMGSVGSGKTFLYRLSSNRWHMPVATSEWLVYHETYTGPFTKEVDVEFPDWAPKETDTVEVKRFLASL